MLRHLIASSPLWDVAQDGRLEEAPRPPPDPQLRVELVGSKSHVPLHKSNHSVTFTLPPIFCTSKFLWKWGAVRTEMTAEVEQDCLQLCLVRIQKDPGRLETMRLDRLAYKHVRVGLLPTQRQGTPSVGYATNFLSGEVGKYNTVRNHNTRLAPRWRPPLFLCCEFTCNSRLQPPPVSTPNAAFVRGTASRLEDHLRRLATTPVSLGP